MPGGRAAAQELAPLPREGARRACALRLLHLFRAAALCPALAPELTAELRRVSNATRLGLDPSIKHCVCRGCGALLLPGDTASVTANRGALTYACLACGARRRIRRLSKRGRDSPDSAAPAPADGAPAGGENRGPPPAAEGGPGARDAADR